MEKQNDIISYSHFFIFDLLLQMECHLVLFHLKVSEYDQEIPQSHTVDQPIVPWVRAI